MACAFAALYPRFIAVYLTSANQDLALAPASAHFAPYGINSPLHTKPLRPPPTWLAWTHTEIFSFRAFLKQQPSDIIVYTRSSRLSWAAASLGLPTFIELHDPLTPVRTAWLCHLIKTHRLAGLVATTRQLKRDLLTTLRCPEDHILVAGNAACASYVTLPAHPLSHGSAVFNVGYAGSAFRGKGVEVVLACAVRLPMIAFHLIGVDPAGCAALGPLSPNLVFHGRQTHTTTLSLLKSMDALMLPNQRKVIIASGADIGRHTSPLKMFEYMSTGRPIIASDLPVITCVLSDNHNALLSAPDDIAGHCAQIQRLYADPTLGARLGTQAQADFLAHHTWGARARKIQSFISGLESTGL